MDTAENAEDKLRRLRLALLGQTRGSAAPEPVEATFRHTINQLSGVGLMATLDEETATGAILGGFATAFPLCLGIFTDANDVGNRDGALGKCAWGQYGKSRSGDLNQNETDRGADFALVIFGEGDRARVALFQAKRLEGAAPQQATLDGMTPIKIKPHPPVAAELLCLHVSHQR